MSNPCLSPVRASLPDHPDSISPSKGDNLFVMKNQDPEPEDDELLLLQQELADAKREEALVQRQRQKELLRRQIEETRENTKKMKGMSDEEFEFVSPPSQNTRSQDYCRRPLHSDSVADRMSSKSSRNDSRLTRSPNLPRTSKNTSSPKSTRKSPRGQRRTKQKNPRLYPNLYTDSDGDTVDSELENENDSSLNDEDDDNFESRQSSSGTRQRYPTNTTGTRKKQIYPDLPLDADRKDRINEIDSRSKNNVKDESSVGIYSVILIICVLLGVSLFFFTQTSREESIQKTENPPSVLELFKSRFSKIKAKYPSQTIRFWRIVDSQIHRLITDQETYPAVLLLGIPKKSSSIGSCFSNDVVSALNDVFNHTNNGYVDVNNLISVSDDDARVKLALDNKLMEILDKGPGVVLDHVEMLPGQAALLLHGYCDGDNAPYKKSAIFLGLHTKSVDKDQRDLDDELNTLWLNELGEDEMPALRSRIGNNVIVINHEPDFKC